MEVYNSSIPDESEDERLEGSDDDPDWLPESSDRRKKRTLAVQSSEGSDESSDEESCGPQSRQNCSRYLSTQWHDINKNDSEKHQPVWCCNPEDLQPLQSPIDYFQQFFTGELLENIVDQSNLYSIQRDPNKSLSTNVKELEQFIGICVYMSIFGLPRSRMYWASNTYVEKIQNVMSRNRWDQIKNSIHFNDNSCMTERDDGKKDKLFKVRPLIDSLKNKFNEIPLNDQQLCVDEQIIPFKGKSGLKQYNPKKPHKWGYKLFDLCDSHGIMHDFEIYSGQIMPVPNLPDLGASSNMVLR
ncbi:piggyBac transposable element-derived protein 4-like [Bacillus rossius redtenbacheri]|uniref:piggyBac transposable element-derived protein 4-like n=1 Tax=Bacillus rossius redtenbacheri TaxID=93214 RepID=UPI002FDE69DD